MAESVVTVTASGPVGCGKSAILTEIEIALKAIGVPVSWRDEKPGDRSIDHERSLSTDMMELYRPTVVLVEQIIREDPNRG